MKHSLVLGGGGTKGSYELGVFKALKDMNINISAVYGTSVGALNGAMFVQGDIENAEKLWSEIKASDIIGIEENIDDLLEKGGISNTLEFMMCVIGSRGLDVTPLRNLLEEIINEKAIRNSSIDYGIVTFSLKDFKPVKLQKTDIPEGKLIDYLLASAALPCFKKHIIDNKRFLDGAFCDNVPLSFAIDGKTKNIIVVDILSPGIIEKVDTKNLNIIEIKNPFELKGSILNFNKEDIIFNMELGYLDCKKAFGKLKGYRYYFNDDIYMSRYTKNLDSKDIKNIYKCFGVEINHKEIGISSKILSKAMGIIKKNSNEDIITKEMIFKAALEITADFFNIDKTLVYTIDELASKIKYEYNLYLQNFSQEDYLDYLKNSVLLTDRKKALSSLFDSINKEANLIFYHKSCGDLESSIGFRRLVSIIYPKIPIAAALLMILNRYDSNI